MMQNAMLKFRIEIALRPDMNARKIRLVIRNALIVAILIPDIIR